MVRYLSSLVICLLVSLQVYAASFNASVDRKTISIQDTFTLTLRYGEQAGFDGPDITPLQKDFHVLNQQQSRRINNVNGQTESYTDWILTLTPKDTGTFTIPAIEFNGEKTEPITIQVQEVSDAVKSQQEKEFFFDVTVQQQSDYYVQQQILYDEKLYYSVAHDDASLTPLEVTDAQVDPLGDIKQYTTVINGQRFGVYERQYAIYPEVSGELVIPGQRFHAVARDPYDRWSRGRQVSIVSKPMTLQVKSIPDNYPQAPWLPAGKLTIAERFSVDPADWRQGEPVTRIITVKAKGIPGNQLPAVPMPEIDGVRYYPDQTDTSDNTSSEGVEGTSVQTVALVPSVSGRLHLPEIRIPWWNVNSGKLEYAVLPAHDVKVAAAAGTTDSSSGNDNSPAISGINNSSHSSSLVADNSEQQSSGNGLWQALLALSVLINLVLAWLLLRNPQKSGTTAAEENELTERQAWKKLSEACQKGDPVKVHSALLNWANSAQLHPAPITSLPQLAELYSDPALKSALAELDARLFSAQGNSAYNAQNLLSLLKARQALNADKKDTATGLYPA